MMKILSFNIHGGYDRRGTRDLRRIRKMMDDLDIDIGVFQEMETRPSRGGSIDDIATLSGPERMHNLPGLAMKEGEGWYGNLIVSRYPIIRSLIHHLGSERSFEPRNAVDALIQTPSGNIRVIGTHLSLTPWERWAEMNRLVSLMGEIEETEKTPLLLMGDINEWQLSSRLLRYLDTLMKPVPCGKSFPSRFPLFRLDRVWHDHCPFAVTAKTIRGKNTHHFSDHLPVLITLE